MNPVFLSIIMLVLFVVIRNQRLIRKRIHFLTKQNLQIIMTQEELLGQLQALKAQNEKAKVEITGKIAALEGAIANQGNTTPEVDAALADLKQSIQGTDDIVPDAPVEEPAA